MLACLQFAVDLVLLVSIYYLLRKDASVYKLRVVFVMKFEISVIVFSNFSNHKRTCGL